MSTFSISDSITFTITHAREIASKVATDLKRMQRLYGFPSDTSIANFEAEMVAVLKAGYLKVATYGFRKDGQWIEPTVQYTASDLNGGAVANDDPGRIRPGCDISGAVFASYMTYSSSFYALPTTEQATFEKTLPFIRTSAPEPGVKGYLEQDRTYSSGGKQLARNSVRSIS